MNAQQRCDSYGLLLHSIHAHAVCKKFS